jgi:predicted anti-sigma-YlaC factor YlaD
MRELNCNEFVELVTTFLESALDEETTGRFVDHLAGCDGCEAYLDQVRQTIRALGDQPAAASLPDDARESLLTAFRTRKN